MATLYFIFVVDDLESELGILDFIAVGEGESNRGLGGGASALPLQCYARGRPWWRADQPASVEIIILSFSLAPNCGMRQGREQLGRGIVFIRIFRMSNLMTLMKNIVMFRVMNKKIMMLIKKRMKKALAVSNLSTHPAEPLVNYFFPNACLPSSRYLCER
eukprot:GHVT01081865.1.p1 GENE.GHVT01081865.1~~GHVT01081865.1.p1  ORF type:complete len:160 (-),score=10.01 GHVT01081865.1:402-881(-)